MSEKVEVEINIEVNREKALKDLKEIRTEINEMFQIAERTLYIMRSADFGEDAQAWITTMERILMVARNINNIIMISQVAILAATPLSPLGWAALGLNVAGIAGSTIASLDSAFDEYDRKRSR